MAREGRREGFAGYSRLNAGIYHDRLESARARGRTIFVVAAIVALLGVAALCLVLMTGLVW